MAHHTQQVVLTSRAKGMTRASFLIAIVCLLAAPLWANESRSSEPRAVLSELADRVLKHFEKPQSKLSPDFRLTDVVTDARELNVELCDASNYGFWVESTEPPIVWIIYKPRLDSQPRGNYVRVDLQARTRVFADESAPEGRGDFPFPPDQALDAQRRWESTSQLIRLWAFAAWWLSSVIWTFTSSVLVLGARRVDRTRPLRAAVGSSDTHQSALLMAEVQQLICEDRAAMAGLGVVVLFVTIWSQAPVSHGAASIPLWLLLALAALFLAMAAYSNVVNGCSTRRSYSLALAVSAITLPTPCCFAIFVMSTSPGIAVEIAVPTVLVTVFWIIAWLRRRAWLKKARV